MGDDISQENDDHVLAGVADRSLAGPEEVEDRVEEQQGEDPESDTDDAVEHHDVAQDALGRFIVPLPRRIDTRVAAPTPTSDPNAAARFISGKVNALSQSGQRPTPWPMKILSTML